MYNYSAQHFLIEQKLLLYHNTYNVLTPSALVVQYSKVTTNKVFVNETELLF